MAEKLPTQYKTLSREGSSDFTEKKSRFIGYATHVLTVEEAEAYIAEVHRRHPECSAVLYGYICGYYGTPQRFYDSHEPQGGMAILDALKKQGLTACVAAVVRYYGGVQLGAGPLGRAFGRAAAEAVADAQPGIVQQTLLYEVDFSYELSGKLEHFLSSSPYKLQELRYTEKITGVISLKKTDEERFLQDMAALTAGRAQPVLKASTYSHWE